MKSEHVFIPCGEIELEGILHIPGGNSPHPAAVVCHPHPLYGGDMENNVVTYVCQVLVEESVVALRFNFRGVGMSGGSYGGGVQEQDDIKSALDYLRNRPEVDKERLGLVGYSFGGAVAFQSAQKDEDIRLLVLISPALGESAWEELRTFPKPKLVLLGNADMVIPYQRMNKYFREGQQFQMINGADHFWWGFEEEIGKRIRSLINELL